MDNTLNYILKFNSNADRVSTSIHKLDKGLDKVNKHTKTLANNFSKAMAKINTSLGTIKLNSFIQNIQSASQGLDSLNAPGLKLGSSLADLSAITDVTGDGLKKIEGYARDSAKTFGGDAAAGVESYKLILSQLSPEIAKVPEALKNMGTHANTLAKTMGGDIGAATEVLSTAMNQYQVSTQDPIKASKEMGIMMNIMAAGAKEGSAELPQIKAALEQSGMAAKTAGVHFAETNGYIQLLDKAGKKGSEGGVALRNVMASLSQGRFLPKDVQKELQLAGVDISTLTDKSLSLSDRLKPLRSIMHDQALVTKMFGKENSNAAIAMISGISEAERLTDAIQGTNTAYEQAAIVMDSQAEKNARLKARVDDLKISLFNATGGAMGYASVLGDMAFDVSNLLPLFSGFGKMIGFVANQEKVMALWTNIVSGATSVWAGVQWTLNAALTQIFIIPAVILAIAAAITWVVKNTEGWGKAWKHTVEGAKLLFQVFGDSIKLKFMKVISGMMIGINTIKEGWYKFKQAVGIGDSSENQKALNAIAMDTVSRQMAIERQGRKVAETLQKTKEEFSKATGSIKMKVKAEVEDPTGIIAPVIPGTLSGAGGGGKVKPKGTGAGTKTNKAIATGGSKHNYITINLKSLVDELTIKGGDFKENAKQLEQNITDALLRTLAMASTAQN